MLGVSDLPNGTETEKVSKSEAQVPLPLLKNLQGAAPTSDLAPLAFQPHSPKEKSGLGRTILKRPSPNTEVSVPNEASTSSFPNHTRSDNTDSKVEQLAELVRKLTEKIDSSEKNALAREQGSVSSNVPKQKSTAKSKQRCELCHYTTHTTDDCYRILFCMICKQEDHRTSDHKAYLASQNSNFKPPANKKASSSKQAPRPKAMPFQPCPHCGFNDHHPDDYHPDDCMMYPCCDICGDPTHDVSGRSSHPKEKRNTKHLSVH